MRATHSLAVSAVFLVGMTVGSPSWAEGHCNYTQQVTHGTHDVCEMPLDAEDCAALEDRDTIDGTVYAGGACPTSNVVGTCDKGATQIVYYSGNPAKLKTGCGFQGGTWLNGYANP